MEAIRIFIDATIKANYYYMGRAEQQNIEINGIYKILERDLDNLEQYLIDTYGDIKTGNHVTPKNMVKYKVTYKSINRI